MFRVKRVHQCGDAEVQFSQMEPEILRSEIVFLDFWIEKSIKEQDFTRK